MHNSGRRQVRRDRFYSQSEQRRYNLNPNLRQDQRDVKPSITNFEQFLKNTTPIVTARHFPKTSVNESSHDEVIQPYFVLDDLWDSFREWSAYGVRVPLVLDEFGSVVHYYAPYLSAIQLYIDPSTPATGIMRPDEKSILDSSRAPSSDSSSHGRVAVGHEPCAQENNINSISPGLLAYEVFESSSLMQRAPFAQQVLELAAEFPKLSTYRSCDLTPSSWLSVAWCPISAMPPGQSLEEVNSCFLTFHSLSTPLSSTHDGTSSVSGPTISLPAFGLTVCNFRSSDWTGDAVNGMEKVNSLIQSADNWLRSLRVNHPDYAFFKNHTTCSDSGSFPAY